MRNPSRRLIAMTQQPPPSRKMPASHQWAIVSFVAMAGVNLMLNAHGHFDILGVLCPIPSLTALFRFLFYRRSPFTYTIGVIALLCAVLRAGQSVFVTLRDRFHNPAQGWMSAVLTGWGLFLVVALFRAYTLGAASRQYYGLPARPEPNIP